MTTRHTLPQPRPAPDPEAATVALGGLPRAAKARRAVAAQAETCEPGRHRGGPGTGAPPQALPDDRACDAIDPGATLLTAAVEGMSHGIVIYDARETLRYVNARYHELTSTPPSLVRPGMTYREVVVALLGAGAYAAAGLEAVEEIYRTRRARIALGRDVRHVDVLPSGLVLASRHQQLPGGGWVSVFEDVTELSRAEARIAEMALRDGLTGLGNREAFRQALSGMIAGGGGALVLLDLDHFKEANDRHGHDAGDALLIAIAGRLRGSVRPADAVCRLGGDEFAVVLPGADVRAARAAAERAAALAAEPVAFRRAELRVGASAGIAVAPEDGEDADALARAADLALYQSKSERRGKAQLFTANLRAQADQRLALREALGSAIPGGELRLVFQPQRDLATRRLVGAEALLRWRSERLGRDVRPDELFPAAAEARFLQAIDAWVMEEAVRRLAAWADEPAAPPMLSINLSVSTLRDPGIADALAHQLLAARVAPERLEIEVPESLAVRDIEAVRPTLERINGLGVRLALDDFGAGLSSLQHVVGLPVQRLKLDRSVIAYLDGPTPPRAVVRATLALASGMRIEVLAEGVETEAQAFALRREGINLAQGWLTGRPVPEEELLGAPARPTVRFAATK